jgi:hypothetical protein
MSNRSVPAEPLAQARAAAAAGDLDGLAACAAAALGADLAPVVRVDIANCCRDAGHPNLAEPILSALKAERPDYPPPYYELAFIRRQAGRHAEAAFELEDGLRACGRDERLGLAHAHMLYMAGAHERADAALARLDPATPGAAASLRALLEFGQFLRDHPRDGALFQLASLKRAHGHLETAEVAARIEQARAERSGFALLRLGDGEGAWTHVSARDEHAHRHLYAANRGEFTRMWFGDGLAGHGEDFAALAPGVIDAALAADIVGIPYDSWLRHEYDIGSTRGIPSLVNIYRALAACRGVPALCRQNIHIDLHSSGGLARLLRHERAVGLISCHPELPDLLRAHFGFAEVEFHRIPGEVGRACFITGAHELGPHFPAAFRRIQGDLARPHRGRVFLVAGGILGKFYALTIKRHGGVALDVGSLVDAWLRRWTRPGYGEHLALGTAAAG